MTTMERRLRREAAADWLGLAYRAAFYTLVTSPLWGAVLALTLAWPRVDF